MRSSTFRSAQDIERLLDQYTSGDVYEVLMKAYKASDEYKQMVAEAASR